MLVSWLMDWIMSCLSTTTHQSITYSGQIITKALYQGKLRKYESFGIPFDNNDIGGIFISFKA